MNAKNDVSIKQLEHEGNTRALVERERERERECVCVCVRRRRLAGTPSFQAFLFPSFWKRAHHFMFMFMSVLLLFVGPRSSGLLPCTINGIYGG